MTAHDIVTSPHLAKLTVKDFLTLAESGAFERYARTELIEGEIWAVNAIHTRHARMHGTLVTELGAAIRGLDAKLDILIAPSTELSQDSLPEPDIAIAARSEDKVLQGPTVKLAIEIADTSLDIDLGRKARLYARYAVPEYWVVDVERRIVHQLWSPAGEAFAQKREIAFGEPLIAATIAGLTIATEAL
ncbi:Uma2 family endonuclease [Sphingomonas sp.]|jgi:Uma2 family endonuclease|uniref:Uma2 family endonuclease n=1 Tax=Sphingomonas sp. TaxID=28214 RepID=UPI002E30A9A5|nr:Uma2 family endonuclease [Sphingomonas sp.]HEX4693524.1 Uma2 family endonuclease [Sphingomonas sp.]